MVGERLHLTQPEDQETSVRHDPVQTQETTPSPLNHLGRRADQLQHQAEQPRLPEFLLRSEPVPDCHGEEDPGEGYGYGVQVGLSLVQESSVQVETQEYGDRELGGAAAEDH